MSTITIHLHNCDVTVHAGGAEPVAEAAAEDVDAERAPFGFTRPAAPVGGIDHTE